MSIFDEHEKPFEFQKSQPSNLGSVQNFKKITVGEGAQKFEVSLPDGMFMGAETFADAPFKVGLDGSTTLKDILATGGQIVLAIPTAGGDSFIRAGKTDFTNAETGFILGVDDSDSDKPKFYIGSSTKYLNWDGTSLTIRGTLNADDITAGTLIGRTVKATGGAGIDVWMDSSDGQLKFYSSSTKVGYLAGLSDGTYGDGVQLQADNFLYLKGNEWVKVQYNAGGGTGTLMFYNDATLVAEFNDSNNFYVAGVIYNGGNIQCGGTYKSSDGSSGGNYTSYGFVTDPYTPKWREITVKDGLIVNITGEIT